MIRGHTTEPGDSHTPAALDHVTVDVVVVELETENHSQMAVSIANLETMTDKSRLQSALLRKY